jgi:hypothetical protein
MKSEIAISLLLLLGVTFVDAGSLSKSLLSQVQSTTAPP